MKCFYVKQIYNVIGWQCVIIRYYCARLDSHRYGMLHKLWDSSMEYVVVQMNGLIVCMGYMGG